MSVAHLSPSGFGRYGQPPSIFSPDPQATPINASVSPDPVDPAQAARERRARLYLEHPDECPELIGVLEYLIHPPSKLSSSARWEAFRDRTLLPMIRLRPDEVNLPNFLRQVELILAWRATVPPEDRFWKADATIPPTAGGHSPV